MLTGNVLREHLELCTILGTNPQASGIYRRQKLWIGKTASTPAPQWHLEIIVMRNKEA